MIPSMENIDLDDSKPLIQPMLDDDDQSINVAVDDIPASFLSPLLRLDDDRSFDHTMNGHYTVEVNTKSRHKLYTCTRCGSRMDGKNRALQHIAARKPPGTSLKSAKVVHCRNPIEIVKEAVLNHWAEKELLIKASSISNNSNYSSNAVLDGSMEFSDDIMGEQSNEQPVEAESSKTKRPRKRIQQRKSNNQKMCRVVPEEGHHLWMRNSHRSPVLSRKGMCASSQPLASAIGARILQAGGNAADAAVAMAAALNLLEPCSTGIGGDAFALFYNAQTKQVHCLQGNGAAAGQISLEYLNSMGIGSATEGYSKALDPHSALCVTVPGAAALWEDLVQHHGRLQLIESLQPSIDLAREGYPVGPHTARQWSQGFVQGPEAHRVLFRNGRAPVAGEIFTNPDLADTFTLLGREGAQKGFYSGRIAGAIVAAVAEHGGVLTLPDLHCHRTAFEPPLSIVYRGVRIFEPPAPTHGLAVLEALGLLSELQAAEAVAENSSMSQPSHDTESMDYQTHIAVECMRLAYADALQYVCDPDPTRNPVTIARDSATRLLHPLYLHQRAAGIDRQHASEVSFGDVSPYGAGETVYFCCVDGDGNACSMINSNYMGFGSGIMPVGTGFTLQNRGHNFSLVQGHPNQIAPGKKPYHTIIPSLAVYEDDGSLFGTLGCMGGFMQPMGHLQLIRNLLDFGMDPQSAVDAPRWYIAGTGQSQDAEDLRFSSLLLEEGFGEAEITVPEARSAKLQRGRKRKDSEVDMFGLYSELSNNKENDEVDGDIASRLRARGHNVIGPPVSGKDRGVFGRAQIILRNRETGVLWAGSDPRCDGCAVPVV